MSDPRVDLPWLSFADSLEVDGVEVRPFFAGLYRGDVRTDVDWPAFQEWAADQYDDPADPSGGLVAAVRGLKDPVTVGGVLATGEVLMGKRE